MFNTVLGILETLGFGIGRGIAYQISVDGRRLDGPTFFGFGDLELFGLGLATATTSVFDKGTTDLNAKTSSKNLKTFETVTPLVWWWAISRQCLNRSLDFEDNDGQRLTPGLAEPIGCGFSKTKDANVLRMTLGKPWSVAVFERIDENQRGSHDVVMLSTVNSQQPTL
jgi:hypothetical protein